MFAGSFGQVYSHALVWCQRVGNSNQRLWTVRTCRVPTSNCPVARRSWLSAIAAIFIWASFEPHRASLITLQRPSADSVKLSRPKTRAQGMPKWGRPRLLKGDASCCLLTLVLRSFGFGVLPQRVRKPWPQQACTRDEEGISCDYEEQGRARQNANDAPSGVWHCLLLAPPTIL